MMGAMGSQITSLTIVYSTVYSGADQRKQQSSATLAFVRGIHRRQFEVYIHVLSLTPIWRNITKHKVHYPYERFRNRKKHSRHQVEFP